MEDLGVNGRVTPMSMGPLIKAAATALLLIVAAFALVPGSALAGTPNIPSASRRPKVG